MSAPEWKPGDVAAYFAGSGLIVIDPENREQVDRLVLLLADHGWRPTEAHGLRDALREFANPKPPAPEEPTARGSVVKDSSGLEWVRVHPGGKAWVNGYERWASWRELLDIGITEVVRP